MNGHRPQFLLRQNAELKGQRRKNHRRVHVGGVVRGIHRHPVLAQIFRSLHLQPRKRRPHTAPRPQPRNPMLSPPLFIHQRDASAVSPHAAVTSASSGAWNAFVRQR